MKRKYGNQEPTFKKIGRYAYSDGAEVAEMFEEEGGATFFPSQKYELELMLAKNKDGSPAALTICISKPRQNGKSYAARYYAIFSSDFEHKRVLYTAHHSSTTKKMFDAVCSIFENPERFPEFSKDVDHITKGRGYEGIYFRDWKDEDGILHEGGCIEFATRTNAGARGGTYSVVIVDEAQELTEDQLEGMLPVISAASSTEDKSMVPQIIYIGTPPAPTCNGTVFLKMHNTVHSKKRNKIWWLEWSINSIKDITPENAIQLAYETNPAMGYRISEKTIQNEYETMQKDGFARERLGWWTPTASEKIDYAINKAKWLKCESDEQKPEGKTAYGIKFSSDGSDVCLCGAVINSDGMVRISEIERRFTSEGYRWLSDWLNVRYTKASCVVIDGRNGSDLLIDRISTVWKAKGSIIKPGVKDVLAAATLVIDAVNEKKLSWYSGQEDLSHSATTSIKRPISGGFGFGGENSLPIEAAALAYYGALNSKRDPTKKAKIG